MESAPTKVVNGFFPKIKYKPNPLRAAGVYHIPARECIIFHSSTWRIT